MNKQKDVPTEQEINRKRKSSHEFQIPVRIFSDINQEEEDNDLLSLSLSFPPTTRPAGKVSAIQQQLQPPPPPPPEQPRPQGQSQSAQAQSFMPLRPPLSQDHPLHDLSQTRPLYIQPLPMPTPPLSSSPPAEPVPVLYSQESSGPSRQRQRRNPSQAPREGKSETVPAPYPWATNHRATIHSLNYLLSKQIFKITGEVQCKRCERQYEMDYDLRGKFVEVGTFIAENKSGMHHRAPGVWMNPILPTCRFCEQENSLKPIISKKRNRLIGFFLLLGQLLGCCTLEQLKYFCKHTKNHRTGAKDRVLYLTYLSLCKQLDPSGPFDR